MSITISPSGSFAIGPVVGTSGAGYPSGTPATAELYYDTTNGGLWYYGPTSSGWQQVGGNFPGSGHGGGLFYNGSVFGVANGGGFMDVSSAGLITANGGISLAGSIATSSGGISTTPAASSAPTLSLGTAYQNTLGYDVVMTVGLNVTADTSLVLKLGTGSTNTPSQQTIQTSSTITGFYPVSFALANQYFALLSSTGTGTVTVVGQSAQPV